MRLWGSAFKNKKVFTALTAALIGVLVAVVSWWYLQDYMRKATAAVEVLVPKRNIPPYSVIKQEDLGVRKFPVSAVDQNTVRSVSEVAGKAASVTLYAGKPIDKRWLIGAESGAISGRYVVGVRTDAARAAGVRPGDVVDVYWIAASAAAAMGQTNTVSVRVASDALVLDVSDGFGISLDQLRQGLVGEMVKGDASRLEPKIIYLLVKSEEVPQVIAGASEKGATLAVAKKPVAAREGIENGNTGKYGSAAEGVPGEKNTEPGR